MKINIYKINGYDCSLGLINQTPTFGTVKKMTQPTAKAVRLVGKNI